MADTTDVTVAVLKEIREEIRSLRGDVTDLRGDLNDFKVETRERFEVMDQRFDAFGRRLVESEIRTATALTDLAGSVRELTATLRAQGEPRKKRPPPD